MVDDDFSADDGKTPQSMLLLVFVPTRFGPKIRGSTGPETGGERARGAIAAQGAKEPFNCQFGARH